MRLRSSLLALPFFAFVLYAVVQAPVAPAEIGVVVMHGKGSAPSGSVAPLAQGLQSKGLRVANLEMPWSGARNYDVDVAAAERQVEAALHELRAKGAKKLFLAGHSQGGMFAAYLGGRLPVDGVIAIAPGGSTAGAGFQERLGEQVESARKLVAEGKGAEKVRLLDSEGARGTYPVVVAPVNYVSWFDPEGAMNGMKSMRNMNAAIPFLYVAPTNDYPGLRRAKERTFSALPPNRLTRLAEVSSDHRGAPAACVDVVAAWIGEVLSSPSRRSP